MILGCIADDFTGATDLGLVLAQQGMAVVQTVGIPPITLDLGEVDAVIVALKSRTAPPQEAIADSLAALAWLQSLGAKQYLFKYCSTFDSTDEGNIGPVADALLDALGADFTIACPAYPSLGRTIKEGALYVGNVKLSESAMRDHPLTPMTDSNLVQILSRQTPHTVGLISHDTVAAGVKAIQAAMATLRAQNKRYAILDVIADGDLLTIGEAVAALPLITGGSGIALGLPENYRRQGLLENAAPPRLPNIAGPAVVLSGSCSEQTRKQVAHMKQSYPALALDPIALAAKTQRVADVIAWAAPYMDTTPVLIYSSGSPASVRAVQKRLGREAAGQMIEQALAEVARELVKKGVRRLVVAGGETSGAVVRALSIQALRIGPAIDPGVPWTESIGDPTLALALKSGNFGSDDFFIKALEMLP